MNSVKDQEKQIKELELFLKEKYDQLVTKKDKEIENLGQEMRKC